MSLPTLVQLPDGPIGGYSRGNDSPDTPAVLVLQEIFGVNSSIRATVDWLAELGYYAVAPDLFWRQRPGISLDPDQPDSRPQAMALAETYGKDQRNAIGDLLHVGHWLRERHNKVAVVGYCLGGKMSLQCWLHGMADASVVYYGVGMAPLLSASEKLPSTPLLMHLGATDPLNPPDVQQQIVQSLNGAVDATVVAHEGVGHAFARRGASTYVAAAATAADLKTLSFLQEHLT